MFWDLDFCTLMHLNGLYLTGAYINISIHFLSVRSNTNGSQWVQLHCVWRLHCLISERSQQQLSAHFFLTILLCVCVCVCVSESVHACVCLHEYVCLIVACSSGPWPFNLYSFWKESLLHTPVWPPFPLLRHPQHLTGTQWRQGVLHPLDAWPTAGEMENCLQVAFAPN